MSETTVEAKTSPKAKKDHTAIKNLAKHIAAHVVVGVVIHYATKSLIDAVDHKFSKQTEE